jgi:RNA polymerase sigma-54 factor
MEMKQSLSQRLTTQLIMTPRLQQALKLLQVPTLELQQILKQELMQNPLLEEVDEVVEDQDTQQAEADPGEPSEEPESEKDGEEDIDWSEFMQEGLDRTYVPAQEQQTEFYEKVPVTRMSLAEHLTNQLRLMELAPEVISLGEFLIGSLDDRGYLATPITDVAESTGRDQAEVEHALKIVQSLEPAGVGARDLRECLLLQLQARKQDGTLAWRIVDEHFDRLVNNKKAEIARSLRVAPEEVQEATDALAQLSPKPGLEITTDEDRYVVPDLIVERVGEDYVVLLNDRNVPRLRITQAYEKVLREAKKPGGRDTTRDYIQSKLNSARWLIQTIEQRRRTMIKVMNCIIQEQREFFDKGIQFLRPLTLQQVARQIDMHESTVSRVTTNKYVQTPRGVFELKFFFSSGITTQDGEDVSSKTAREAIRQFIEEEEKRDPLSDQKIAEMLQGRGMNIARRTVAKYREQLNILPARFRRRI